MNLLTTSVFRLLRFNLHVNVKQANQRYCNVANNELKSVLFTDHKIIYTFPYIMVPQFFNKLKRTFTIGIIPVYPINLCLGLPTNEALQVWGIYTLMTALWHVGCFPFNNLIGVIYFKEDAQKVIISYINYWGKRIDLKRDVNIIIPPSEHRIKFVPNLYKFLRFKDCNKKLKLLVEGNTHGRADFHKLFGTFQ